MELSTLLRTGSLEKKLGRYQFWGLAVVVLLGVVTTSLVFRQKLQNDQIELAQPDGSFVFEGELATLPTFGQTFMPRQAGLRGIYIPISVEAASKSHNAALTLHLRAGPEATEDIRIETLPLADLEGQNLARFSFEPLPDSFNTRYYFWLEPIPGKGEAKIELRYDRAAAYVDGALYIDGQPQDFQANFLLAYDRSLILLDWGNWFIQHATLLLAMALLTLLPGGALLVWLMPKAGVQGLDPANNFNHIEWIALASGLSLSLYPILLLLADLVNIRLGPGSLTVFLALSAVLIIVGAYYHWQNKLGSFWNEFRQNSDSSSGLSSFVTWIREFLALPSLLFWLIFLLSAGVRIFVVRGQDVPLWQDSYHHTIISQLLIDNGGLFDSWAPYASIETFSYHFGFHAFVAAYQWLTGSNIFQAVLAVGQLMNLLAAPMAYLLGRRLGGDAWTGTFAALITGLLSEYPMFYVNWGRYTQLAGQVILPTAMILTWLVLKNQRPNYKLIGLTAISLAGLALTHYRVLLFYPCFVAPLILLRWLRAGRSFHELQTCGLRLGAVAFGACLLITPWLWRVVGNKLWHNTFRFLTPAGANSEFVQTIIQTTPSVFDYVPPFLVIVGLMGMLWGSWQRREGIILTAGWGLALVIAANPHFLYLPGTGIVTYFTVLIAAYLPFSILAGFALAQVAQFFAALHRLAGWGVALLVLAASLAGAAEHPASFELDWAMVTKPDLAAMDWIRHNTLPEATFWINARLAYADNTVVGTDAGWWIPFLTGRKNLILPMIYGSELTMPADYRLQTIALLHKIHHKDLTSAEDWQTLRQAGVTHLYIGQRRGEVWRGEEQPLDPLALQASPYYRVIYRRDQVWIFALK
jgi:hypothetical protein